MLAGRRLLDGFHFFDAEPGDYWKQSRGTVENPGVFAESGVDFDWTVKDPYGRLGTISTHEVTEHADRTITVDPSIFDTTSYRDEENPGYHGYLVAGNWTPGVPT